MSKAGWTRVVSRLAAGAMALSLIVLGPAPRARAAETTVTFTDFADRSALQLSGATASNNASTVNYGGQAVLRLTTGLGQAGGAFLKNPIPLVDPSGFRASFSTAFTFQITSPVGCVDTDGVQGADGLVFVVQTNSNQYGGAGVGIGYQGIPRSVGVEFDTWNNGWIDQNSGNHVGIDLNGNIASAVLTPVSPAMNNGQVWYAWVDYNGDTKALEVRLSQASERPATALITHTVDLPAILGVPEAYAGFTSGTGCAGGHHDIRSWQFTNTYKPIEEIKLDTTPPVITPTVTGTRGTLADGTDSGWYVSPVTVSWTVEDAESEVTSTTGCDTTTVLTDTAGASFTCTATSEGGIRAETVSFKVDQSPPSINYVGNAGTYGVDGMVSITCTAADALSGLASTTCANVTAPAYTFDLGTTVLTAAARDNAGNTGAGSTSFTVTVDGQSLCALVRQFVANKGIANALCAKLEAAEAAGLRGNLSARDGAVGAFINQVQAQTGKALTQEQAGLLVRLAQAL